MAPDVTRVVFLVAYALRILKPDLPRVVVQARELATWATFAVDYVEELALS